MKRRIWLHIIIWLCVGVLEFNVYPGATRPEGIIFFVSRMILYISLFYFNAIYLYPALLKRKTLARGIVMLIASAAIYTVVTYQLFEYFYFDTMVRDLKNAATRSGLRMSAAQQARRGLVGVAVIYYVASFVGGMFYWMSRRVRIANAGAAQLEKEKIESEYEKIRLQNQFLRSQINPHFLHNTLNFFYAKLLPVSAELSEGILTLSNVMRYSLQHDEDERGMVYLDKETEHLRNVIAIHQMRFSNNLNIRFTIKGNTDGVKVIPLVFITLAENGFKHGHLTDANEPLSIELEVDDKEVIFVISNRKKTGPREISHGIGIDNIRRRLEYVYGKDYTFDIRDGGDSYRAEVRMPLIKK